MRKILKYVCASVLSLALIAAVYYEYNFLTGNFHAITAGEAYRSMQLSNKQLEYYTDKYKIASILNLRGKEPESRWYKDELEISAARHIAHYDITLSAFSEPSDKDIEKMIEIFKTAPRPILIHCLGGADRSGLAAAIWKRVVDKQTKGQAARQLSLLYGHLPIGKATVMDARFKKME